MDRKRYRGLARWWQFALIVSGRLLCEANLEIPAGYILSNKTDIPALSAAATASSVSIFLASGPYNSLNLIMSLTLLCLVCGYTISAERTCLESLAFSFVLAFVALPGIGYIREYQLGSVSLNHSLVTENFMLLAWVAVIALVFLLDQFVFQRAVISNANTTV